jgi:transposase
MREVDIRDARIAQLKAQLAERDTLMAQMRKRMRELMAEEAELRARLGQNFSNSQRPPSSGENGDLTTLSGSNEP